MSFTLAHFTSSDLSAIDSFVSLLHICTSSASSKWQWNTLLAIQCLNPQRWIISTVLNIGGEMFFTSTRCSPFKTCACSGAGIWQTTLNSTSSAQSFWLSPSDISNLQLQHLASSWCLRGSQQVCQTNLICLNNSKLSLLFHSRHYCIHQQPHA